jgi:hypothetical protein
MMSLKVQDARFVDCDLSVLLSLLRQRLLVLGELLYQRSYSRLTQIALLRKITKSSM